MSDGAKEMRRDIRGELNRLGSIEFRIRDANGKTTMHFREGRNNLGVGLVKALTTMMEKSGLTPDDIERELEAYRAEHSDRARRMQATMRGRMRR